jgi:hypothetical protein
MGDDTSGGLDFLECHDPAVTIIHVKEIGRG